MFQRGRAMKKLMLVGLLTALIGVPIGNALAQEGNVGATNLGDPGVYLYFPVVPSNFFGFDSTLFMSAFVRPVSLEVNTAGLDNLPGSPVQQTNVDIPRVFASAVLASRPAVSPLNFQCVPAPGQQGNLCQLFIHHQRGGTFPSPAPACLDFTATLLVTSRPLFQFITSPWQFTLGPQC